MIYIAVAILGSIVGSFLTVCVYRLPKKISIITPRSFCPACGRTIAWFDNIPILSFLLLGAKCRNCRAKIPTRYILIEILSAASAVILFGRLGLGFDFFILYALTASLIVVTFIDLAINEIPDEITIPGMILGVVLSAVYPGLQGEAAMLAAVKDSIAGLMAGGLSIYLIGKVFDLVYFKLLKHPPVQGESESMGGGDVMLLAMIGAFLGWQKTVLIFFIAPLFGSAAGIILKIKKIPYGPYLSLAAFIAMVWGEGIINFLFRY